MKKEKLVETVGGLRTMDDVGIKINKLKHLKLHAKMLLRDHSHGIMWSIASRKLPTTIGSIHTLDLTDEGPLAEYKDHDAKGAEGLALHGDDHDND